MTQPRWQTLRIWRLAGAVIGLAVCCSAFGLAQTVGAEDENATLPLTVDNPFVSAAKPPAAESHPSDVGDAKTDAELPPMYRLPPVEEEPVAGTSSEPSGNEDADIEHTDIRPIPAGPTDELLDEMDAFWSDSNEITPAPHPSAGAAAAVPYTPTVAELSAQLLPSVRKAYGLSQRGAVYAAQTEFIQVLRRVAQTKDAAAGVDTHSRSLAAGLRALDEADDFVPQGAQLEAEMNVEVVASSHRTPRANRSSSHVLPHEAVAMYHQFAREQLAQAVAGEQAGSMALYGLGKVQNRLAYEAEGELRHQRKALTMFRAALDAGPTNHLAANEIGVLLSRGGQPAEAAAMFQQAIDIAPTSVTYHNLAVVERKLGNHEQSAANEQYAQHLAASDRAAGVASRNSGVEWVTPENLNRVTHAQPRTPTRLLRQPAAPGQTIARWPQKLIPGVFRQ